MFHPGDTLDRFQLERLAGAGGMGEVWLARDRTTSAPVAVKLLTKAGREDHSVRFVREAMLLAQLSHPRIVRYVAHGVLPDGTPYLVMEWLDGEDLALRLEAGPLSIGETIALVRCVAEGLTAAHAAGVVHRDIKPSNLFLPHGRIDGVKLVDFGVARIKDSTWTKTGLMLGTPAYMAPEQAYGEREIDARADLFALGCVAFECLTGRRAFAGTQLFAVLRSILLEEAPSLAELVAGVPPELDELVRRMMAKDPAARPQTAANVEKALEGLAAGSRMPRATPTRLLLTSREQRIVTVLSVSQAPLPVSGPTAVDSTAAEVLQPSPDTFDPTGTLRVLLESNGGKIGRCSSDSFVLVFPASGVPADRAAQGAECALALDGIWPGRPMALASGRTEMGTWTDGLAARRASQLLAGSAERTQGTPASNILVDDVTASLLDARFELVDGPDSLELRGNTERAVRDASTPFVGREREMDAVRALLEQCVEEEVARVVLVTAPPGMGKSRLRREVLAGLARADTGEFSPAPRPRVWTARGHAMRAGSPFGLVLQLTRAQGVCVDDALPISAEAQQAWIDGLARECGAAPVLLVLEDLQWGDPISVKMLDRALRDLRDAPLMVMAFARPEVHELFPKLWSERAVEEIRLTALTRSASERLVSGLLGEAAGASEVARIVEQSDGVPVCLEALARAPNRGDDERMPEAALAMVQSRIEKLDANARLVLRAASIFGQTFWEGGVRVLVGGATVLPDALADLLEASLISERPNARFAGEREYEFRTVLAREGAYAMLTDADACLGHTLAGEWLERMGELDAAVISRHYKLGGRRGSHAVKRDACG